LQHPATLNAQASLPLGFTRLPLVFSDNVEAAAVGSTSRSTDQRHAGSHSRNARRSGSHDRPVTAADTH